MAPETGREPKEPKLIDVGFAGEDRRTRVARRIDRGIGDRNSYEDNEGQGQADRERREAGRRSGRRCPKNNEQKEKRK
jgi:hypothetical protein